MAWPRGCDSRARWYNEGSAVFFETWMAGGLGRAQGGYDEMVFRAKDHDHLRLLYARLYRASELDQVGGNVRGDAHKISARTVPTVCGVS